jgi:hypothetical protein
MKNNIHKLIPVVAVLTMFLAFSAPVSAITADLKAQVNIETDGSHASTGESDSESVRATTSAKIGDDNNKEEDESAQIDATSSEKEDSNDNAQGNEHKSKVAVIVAGLLSDADRDQGIGEDVRAVAMEQASTSVKVKEDMDEIDSESSAKVFFFGTNFKNTGDLRSSIVTTKNHIARLKKAEDKATSTSVKADLALQIAALQATASTTESFVVQHEGKFSLFGWFVRIFSK